MQETETKTPSKINKFKISTLILASLLLIGGGYYFYQYTKRTDSITVIGKSTTKIQNQVSQFGITLESINYDKSKAVSLVTEKAKKGVESLKGFGIQENDIRTTNLSVYQREEPYLDAGVTKYRKADWMASYTIEITLRDVSKSEDLAAFLTTIDGYMWGPNFHVDESLVDNNRLLSEAIEDAKVKAQAMASKTGKRVGEVIKVVETGATDPNIQVSLKDGSYSGMGGGMGLEPGSSQIYKTVSVTFRLL